jgi:hypothetical protein
LPVAHSFASFSHSWLAHCFWACGEAEHHDRTVVEEAAHDSQELRERGRERGRERAREREREREKHLNIPFKGTSQSPNSSFHLAPPPKVPPPPNITWAMDQALSMWVSDVGGVFQS